MAYKGNAHGGPVACIDVRAFKFNNKEGKNAYTKVCGHNFRLDAELKELGLAPTEDFHIDHERTQYNKILIDDKHYSPTYANGETMRDENGEPIVGEYSFVKSVQDKFEEIMEREAAYNKENNIPYSKRKFRVKNDPNNTKSSSVSSVSVVMGLTDGFQRLPGWEDGFDFEAWKNGDKKQGAFDLDKWVEDSMKYLKEMFGEDNITYAVLHMDEYSPHIHAMVTPITNDGRLSARDWDLWKKEEMSKKHQQYYEAVKQPGIQRAIPGLSYAFHGKDAQNKQQAALYLKSDVEILPPARENEDAKTYQKRAEDNVKIYTAQKQLEIETLERKLEIERLRLDEQIKVSEAKAERAEYERKKAEEKSDEFKLKYSEEKNKTTFYEDQLVGSGVPRSALQSAELLSRSLNEKHTQEVKAFAVKNAKLQERLNASEEEKEEILEKLNKVQDELKMLQTVIDANGVTKGMLLNNSNMEYIKYGLASMPGKRAEDFKKELLYWLKTGQGIKDRERSR